MESRVPAQRQLWPSEVILRLIPMNGRDTIPNPTFADQESRENACARVSPAQYSRSARELIPGHRALLPTSWGCWRRHPEKREEAERYI
ncbi:MAG: hypothetical protein Q9185_004799 [Variospora sp. 1 TL-2023]